MFLSKIFKKDYRHFINQGEKFFSVERYADARCAFQDALEKCPSDAHERDTILGRLRETGNALAKLNIAEGEGALNGGDSDRALDYFNFAFELADDAQLRETAGKHLAKVRELSKGSLPENNKDAHGHGGHCGGCGGHAGETPENEDLAPSHLSDHDRFHLLIQPLPEDLPGRYAAMGEKFATAYLKIQDGNDAGAFPILEELLRNSPSDVVMYEVALIMYRARRPEECESLLKQALAANPRNALAYFTLVHLCTESGRFPEAIQALEHMVELGLLADQAKLTLGEVCAVAGDREGALAHWSEALSIKSVEKAAAERLVPLLNEMGRHQEAQYLAKRCQKGCC